LARAMLQNGRFWLLDEPTASLDARSEKLVMEGINKYAHATTNLMITHQLAPLQNVSQILVMQDGQIVQRGDYATLSTEDGLFKDMLEANLAQRETDKGNLDA
ncbi:cysteine/glutathione ABC transporter permease/ATP-binding protein CydD, partial [Vibrio parahaemolyticus]|nr:cysteine/glutathione ABC transporter permease/ATP-binding protein CydD [Vibrio parahaemolyticus]NMS30739.1 cysteine/glutathione ABC transporter permease/ATP-binding protein CydD [Vibrio parahaemolyticus]